MLSESRTTEGGVPQGSACGLLFFLLLLIDLKTALLYMDDWWLDDGALLVSQQDKTVVKHKHSVTVNTS